MANKIISDFNKLLFFFKKQGGWVLFGRVYLMFINLVTSIVLTRLLTVDEYGQYKYYISIFAILALFSMPESVQVIIRYIPRGMNYLYDRMFKFRIKISCFISVVLALFYYLFSKTMSASGFYEYDEYIFLLLIVFPFFYSFQVFESYLQSIEHYKELNKIRVIRITIRLLFIVLLYLVFKSIEIALVLSLVVVSAINLYCFYKTKTANNLNKSVEDFSIIKKGKKEAVILSLVGVLPILVENLDKILIVKYIDERSLAIFSIGILLGQAINGFFKPFMSSLSAKLVFVSLRKEHYIILLVLGTLTGGVLSLFTNNAIQLVYGYEYIGSVIYCNVILSSMGLYFFQTMYYNSSLYNKNSSIKSVYFSNVIQSFIILAYIIYIFFLDFSVSEMLLLLSLTYPIKLILSIVVIYFSRKIIIN